MSTINLDPQATGALPVVRVSDERAPHPRNTDVPAWFGAAQLGASIAAVACGWFAVILATRGFQWAALPMAVLTIGILAAAFAPDVLGAYYDRADAADVDA